MKTTKNGKQNSLSYQWKQLIKVGDTILVQCLIIKRLRE